MIQLGTYSTAKSYSVILSFDESFQKANVLVFSVGWSPSRLYEIWLLKFVRLQLSIHNRSIQGKFNEWWMILRGYYQRF